MKERKRNFNLQWRLVPRHSPGSWGWASPWSRLTGGWCRSHPWSAPQKDRSQEILKKHTENKTVITERKTKAVTVVQHMVQSCSVARRFHEFQKWNDNYFRTKAKVVIEAHGSRLLPMIYIYPQVILKLSNDDWCWSCHSRLETEIVITHVQKSNLYNEKYFTVGIGDY